MRSSTETLIAAMRILARDIQSDDGVANAAIAEAADRLQELSKSIEWPPATENMTASQMVKLRSIATDFVQHLEAEIPKRCVHQWGNPRRDLMEVQSFEQSDEIDHGFGEGRYVTEIVEVWKRTCAVCGKTECAKPKITESCPFED